MNAVGTFWMISRTYQTLRGHEPHYEYNAIDCNDAPEHRILWNVIKKAKEGLFLKLLIEWSMGIRSMILLSNGTREKSWCEELRF